MLLITQKQIFWSNLLLDKNNSTFDIITVVEKKIDLFNYKYTNT